MRECAECNVLVCEYCLQDTPPCPCAFCSSTYHCPVCTQKPAIKLQCVREEELRQIEETRLREKARVKREEEARMRADEVAVAVGEFYGLLHEIEIAETVPEVVGVAPVEQ